MLLHRELFALILGAVTPAMLSSPAQAGGWVVNHACTILNPAHIRVGIGIYVDAAGTTWLTEGFTG